ncbi:amidase domain-containing protein [Nocardia terpenica]|uniref:Amidase n=1 Tax=Nocardia terpenica TaxID=455432 RepID=A0A291RGF2_9NOCA|nr:amidase domain-containing protein [Nocardia terpenica]ATL66378.1 amidase [Nocardia terpenica]
MVTFAELRDAKPDSWTTAADDILSAAKQCERIKDDIHDNGAKPLDASWTGKAYGRARDVLTKIANQAEVTSILARSVVDPLDTLNHAIQTAQNELFSGIYMVSAAGLLLDQDSGLVSLPSDVPQEEIAEKTQAQSDAQKLINDAIEAANQADALCTQALTAAANADITKATVDDAQKIQADNTKKALEELRDTLPDGLPPNDVSAWWNALSPEEQYDLERACPTELYDLPGIPDSVKKDIDRSDLGYSSVGTVRYAEQNWNQSSMDWEGKDNCTNFASNALAYGGGMKFKEDWGGLIPRHFDTKGWSDGTNGDGGDPLPPGTTHTPTWGAAQNNHDFFLGNGGTVVSPNQARPGDLMYYTETQNTDNLHPGETHHTVVVTAVLPDNQVLYTQHSDDAENYPLYGRLPEFQQSLGRQNIQIVQPKVTW